MIASRTIGEFKYSRCVCASGVQLYDEVATSLDGRARFPFMMYMPL